MVTFFSKVSGQKTVMNFGTNLLLYFKPVMVASLPFREGEFKVSEDFRPCKSFSF